MHNWYASWACDAQWDLRWVSQHPTSWWSCGTRHVLLQFPGAADFQGALWEKCLSARFSGLKGNKPKSPRLCQPGRMQLWQKCPFSSVPAVATVGQVTPPRLDLRHLLTTSWCCSRFQLLLVQDLESLHTVSYRGVTHLHVIFLDFCGLELQLQDNSKVFWGSGMSHLHCRVWFRCFQGWGPFI